MGFNKMNEKMNYNFEFGGKSEIYEMVYSFVADNADILSVSQLQEFESFLLPPLAFDDGKVRSVQKYSEASRLINEIIINKKQELGQRVL